MLYQLQSWGSESSLEKVKPEALTYDPARRRIVVFPGGAVYASMWELSEAYGAKKRAAEEATATPGDAAAQAAVKRTENAVDRAQRRYRHRIGGMIQCIEQTIAPLSGKSAPPVDIYLYVNEEDPKEFHNLMSKHYAKEPGLAKTYAASLGEGALLPLLLKPGEVLERLSKEELMDRFSHLTCIGHSLGSVINRNAADYLAARLQAAKWQTNDISEVMHELVTVSVASVARQDLPEPGATQFFFTAHNDKTARKGVTGHAQDEAGQQALLEACGYPMMLDREDEGRAEAIAPNCYRIRANMPLKVTWKETRTSGVVIAHTIPREGETRTGMNAVEHDYRAFLYGKLEHAKPGREDAVHDHLCNIMRNAVTRNPGIGSGADLLKGKPSFIRRRREAAVSSELPISPEM